MANTYVVRGVIRAFLGAPKVAWTDYLELTIDSLREAVSTVIGDPGRYVKDEATTHIIIYRLTVTAPLIWLKVIRLSDPIKLTYHFKDKTTYEHESNVKLVLIEPYPELT